MSEATTLEATETTIPAETQPESPQPELTQAIGQETQASDTAGTDTAPEGTDNAGGEEARFKPSWQAAEADTPVPEAPRMPGKSREELEAEERNARANYYGTNLMPAARNEMAQAYNRGAPMEEILAIQDKFLNAQHANYEHFAKVVDRQSTQAALDEAAFKSLDGRVFANKVEEKQALVAIGRQLEAAEQEAVIKRDYVLKKTAEKEAEAWGTVQFNRGRDQLASVAGSATSGEGITGAATPGQGMTRAQFDSLSIDQQELIPASRRAAIYRDGRG